MTDVLVLRDNAKQQLAEIKSIETGINYLNKVKAIEVWAKAEKKDAELQNMIAEQKIRTQRILGQLLKESEVKNHGKNQYNAESNDTTRQSLSAFGITKDQSSTFQKIAALPEEIFEREIAVAKDESKKRVELTTSRLLTAAKKYEFETNIEKQKHDIENGKLPELIGSYDVISIDPPWPYGREYDPNGSRVANPYPEMNIEDIKNIELSTMENSIVLLWTTHMFLPHAFDILKSWNHEYKATIVWNKDKIGMGSWFRMQCEFCLLGIKGKPYWNNTTYRDIFTEPRREHSRKPDAFFKMIEEITIGRRLEYFSREKRDGWDIYGNDVNKF
jgi:N6-adenosine-specific RNA methylase IME4